MKDVESAETQNQSEPEPVTGWVRDVAMRRADSERSSAGSEVDSASLYSVDSGYRTHMRESPSLCETVPDQMDLGLNTMPVEMEIALNTMQIATYDGQTACRGTRLR
jgi:hypothetical protein